MEIMDLAVVVRRNKVITQENKSMMLQVRNSRVLKDHRQPTPKHSGKAFNSVCFNSILDTLFSSNK